MSQWIGKTIVCPLFWIIIVFCVIEGDIDNKEDGDSEGDGDVEGDGDEEGDVRDGETEIAEKMEIER